MAPREVSLTSGSDSKVYDGTALVKYDVIVGGDGFVTGEGATYEYTGSQTVVGLSENFFTYTLDEGTKAGNYTITTANGTLTVTKATVTLTLGATGKISGKFTVAKKAYSFSGMAYLQESAYHATLSVKYGSKAYPIVMAIGQDGETGKAFAEIAVVNGVEANISRLDK